jgi:hypothetical protein
MESTSIELIPELVKKIASIAIETEDLKKSPILVRFLKHVVLTKLSAREDEIKVYTIGVKALGRPIDLIFS